MERHVFGGIRDRGGDDDYRGGVVVLRNTDGDTRGETKSGAEGRSGDEAAGRGNTGKSTSAAADEAGARGCHGARPELRGGIAD